MPTDQGLSARTFDAIIAGGGAAGCVLAGRLSEDSDKQVLLVEAGPDAPAEKEHRDIRDPFPVSWSNPRFGWKNLSAEAGADPGDGTQRRSGPYFQGYGLGGGSNVNGMGADRGQPGDYDEWRDLGASGWGWDDVLPYFKQLEKDADFNGPLHGRDGPVLVRRIRPAEWAPFALAIGHAVHRRGYPQLEDYNGDFRDGVSAFPMNCTPTRRISASMAYLPRDVRQRRNLTILTDTTVDRLNLVSHGVKGIVVRRAGVSVEIQGRQTLLSCGALQTPSLLMRSGIGPAEHLHSLGIPVVADIPGVGRNLQNHPALMLAAHLKRAAMQPRRFRSLLQNIVRYSSRHCGCQDHDMLLYPFNRSSWHPLGRRIGALVIYVNKPYSLGSVKLAGADSRVAPKIHFDLLSDRRDLERMIGGLRFALELLLDPEVVSVRNEVFVPNGAMVARLAQRTPGNSLKAWAAARALDTAQMRHTLLGNDILDVEILARAGDSLERLVRRNARAAYHVCGTCRMGDADDPAAVVDPAGRVRGIQGLRVGDASIFPTIPRANTHLTVLMAAEKIAGHVRADWRAAHLGS